MFAWCLKSSNSTSSSSSTSKCTYAVPTVSYLGHVVSAADVAMDHQMVHVVDVWPIS